MLRVLLFQPLDNIIVIDEISDCCEGNGQKDACDANQPAADDQGNQDPDGGDAELLTEQAGFDDISVDRLQDRCKQ